MYELKEELNIENMIYEIRGKQVMLDSDLAKLYECKNGTKEINQAVKNNPDKFPNDFYFRLSEVELKYLWSKNLTANRKKVDHYHMYLLNKGLQCLQLFYIHLLQQK